MQRKRQKIFISYMIDKDKKSLGVKMFEEKILFTSNSAISTFNFIKVLITVFFEFKNFFQMIFLVKSQ